MLISTDLHCANAAAPNGQIDVPVAGLPGLYLRVTKDGVKTWTVRSTGATPTASGSG